MNYIIKKKDYYTVSSVSLCFMIIFKIIYYIFIWNNIYIFLFINNVKML